MVSESPEDTFSDEVEDRLEHLFGEEEPAEMTETNGGAVIDYPLRELKTIILSIDWEITPEVMAGFVDQIGVLQDKFSDDKIVLVFLQLLGSLGEYIRKNLGQSHPEAFRNLNSLFVELEKIVQDEDLTANEKKRILSTELSKYKQLKGELTKTKTPATVTKAATVTPPLAQPDAPQPDIAQAIADLKHIFQRELQALREEIKALRDELARGGNSSEG